MDRRLKVTVYRARDQRYLRLSAHRVRIEVTDPSNSGADVNVFMLLRGVPNPYNGGEAEDVFHAVASPVDLAEYPVGQPNAQTEFPFYRASVVELDLRTAALADELCRTIIGEVSNLLAALKNLDALAVDQEMWLGGAPPEDGSSSSSQ